MGAVSKYADDVADLTDDTFGSVYKKKIASESSEYVDDIVRSADVKQPKNIGVVEEITDNLDDVVDELDDEITSFADLMTPEEAARYNQYWDDLEKLKSTTVADDLVDDVAKYTDELAEGGTVPKINVGNTDISIDNFTAKDIPTVKNGEFNEFFNSLSVDELDALWSKPEIRDVIEARLRSPGGLHEWHLVSRTPQFKYWDVSAEQIKDFRTLTSEVEFVNPSGVHGGRGSTATHNELLKIIDTSNDYDTFIRRLNNWANYRLKGGVEALPEGLQIK